MLCNQTGTTRSHHPARVGQTTLPTIIRIPPSPPTGTTTMTHPQLENVTQLLVALRDGDRGVLDELFRLVYDELHALAHHKRIQWHGDYTLNTTALVHEAYLKLAGRPA